MLDAAREPFSSQGISNSPNNLQPVNTYSTPTKAGGSRSGRADERQQHVHMERLGPARGGKKLNQHDGGNARTSNRLSRTSTASNSSKKSIYAAKGQPDWSTRTIKAGFARRPSWRRSASTEGSLRTSTSWSRPFRQAANRTPGKVRDAKSRSLASQVERGSTTEHDFDHFDVRILHSESINRKNSDGSVLPAKWDALHTPSSLPLWKKNLSISYERKSKVIHESHHRCTHLLERLGDLLEGDEGIMEYLIFFDREGQRQ